jgi:hypothetical protein
MKAKGKYYVLSNVRDFTDVHASSLRIKSFTREEVMIGKEKCRILKEIRQKIADENDIAYVTRECTYQGECRGTCPKCESELKYLEKQLAARAAAGKRIAIAALCAGMTFSMGGCAAIPNNKGKEDVEDLAGAVEPMPEPDYTEVLDGEVGPDYYYDSGDTAENAAADETAEKAKDTAEDSTGENAATEDTAESADVEEETK